MIRNCLQTAIFITKNIVLIYEVQSSLIYSVYIIKLDYSELSLVETIHLENMKLGVILNELLFIFLTSTLNYYPHGTFHTTNIHLYCGTFHSPNLKISDLNSIQRVSLMKHSF